MLYCEDWDKKKQKFLEYWARENHDRPLLHITAPKDHTESYPVSNHTSYEELWMDTEFKLKMINATIKNTAYLGEAYPSYNPNLGPDLIGACYGTEINFGERTSWAVHWMSDQDVEEYEGLSFDRNNKYYKKIIEMTKAAVEDGKDKYLVGITDLHPGADGLVSLRGPQELCYDTLDNPDFIRKGVMDILQDFKMVYQELYGLTTKYQEGSSCWMGIWHPKRWYPISCDFSCMISTDMYEDLFAEELEKEIDFLDASIYHLDGPKAIKHLDRILQMPGLNGVQWVYGAGQPTAVHWIPLLKKIQEAGKCVQVVVEKNELETMLKELGPEGMMYVIPDVGSEEEGRDLIKMAEKLSRNK